jgi:hypothetical protein
MKKRLEPPTVHWLPSNRQEQGGTVHDVVYYAARANIRRLMQLHQDWKQMQCTAAVGISVGQVKKWLKR